jgi:hypothetical protein
MKKSTAAAAPSGSPPTAVQVLERHFLEIRCKILDLAAALDRIDRAAGAAESRAGNGRSNFYDPRLEQLREGVKLLLACEPGRAERVQMLFSDPYDADWRQQYGIPPGSPR